MTDSAGQADGECCGLHKVLSIRDPLPCLVKGSAMVRAGSDEWESQCEIDSPSRFQELYWDQPLIMVERHHKVELPPCGSLKHTVCWQRAREQGGWPWF